MNTKTTTLTPAAIIDKYRGYLSNCGSIKSEREAVWFASSMKSMNSTVERCLFLQILHSTCNNSNDKQIINSLLSSGGWNVLSTWLSEYLELKNKAVLSELLGLLDAVPVTISLLKTGNTGRLIKSITKIDDADLRSLSKNLMKKWMTFISECTNKVKKESDDMIIETEAGSDNTAIGCTPNDNKNTKRVSAADYGDTKVGPSEVYLTDSHCNKNGSSDQSHANRNASALFAAEYSSNDISGTNEAFSCKGTFIFNNSNFLNSRAHIVADDKHLGNSENSNVVKDEMFDSDSKQVFASTSAMKSSFLPNNDPTAYKRNGDSDMDELSSIVEATSLNVGCYEMVNENEKGLLELLTVDSEQKSNRFTDEGDILEDKITLDKKLDVNNDGDLSKLIQTRKASSHTGVDDVSDNSSVLKRTDYNMPEELQKSLKRPKSTVKRKISWKCDEELVSIRYFTKDPEEDVVLAPSHVGSNSSESDSFYTAGKERAFSNWNVLMKVKMEDDEVRSQYGKLSHFKPLQDQTELNKYIYDEDDEELIVPDEEDVHFDTTTPASLIIPPCRMNRSRFNDYPSDAVGPYNRFHEREDSVGHYFNSRANIERAGFLPVSEDTSCYDPQRKLRSLPLHELDDLRKNDKYRDLTFQPINQPVHHNQQSLRYFHNYASEGPRPSLLGRAPIRSRPATQPSKPMKVVLCRMFAKDGFCRFGDNCHFIHNEQAKKD